MRKVSMPFWDIISNVILAAAATGLLILGGFLLYSNRTTAATAALSFAILFSVLLVGARFKHFKGFGFEAEMWDQKQVEAAALIDRLSLLSETTAEQTGLVASRLGFMDSGFTNPELAALLNQMERTLSATGIAKSKRNELEAPVVERIKKNYVFSSKQVADKAYMLAISATDSSLRTATPETRDTLIAKSAQFNQVRQTINNLPIERFIELNSITPIIDAVKSAPDFDGRDQLLSTLSDFDDDLKFFATNLQLRRNIDINYVYR